jgi:hypothetical protein
VSNDKDNIRVDLLKFRRKAYLAYPYGSPERKKFLKVILENELRLTKQEIPQPIIDFVTEGNKTIIWNSLKKFLWCLAASLFCVLVFSFLHSKWSLLILLPGGACLGVGLSYLGQYFGYRKSLQTVKQYSDDMNKYVSKISNEIKRLDGPHGF